MYNINVIHHGDSGMGEIKGDSSMKGGRVRGDFRRIDDNDGIC